MNLRNRLIRAVMAVAAGLVPASAALGQDASYPGKPVKVIVPFGSGGTPDTIARVITQRLGESLGQPFVVENRPGANGIIGCEAAARSAPDGYTLLIVDVGQLAINPAVHPKLPYDSVKDFAPVSLAAIAPLFLTAHASLPVNSLAELIQMAKDKPGQLSYASSGPGSIHHLSMEALKAALGLDIVHIPYKGGSSQSIPALVGGQVPLSYAGLPMLAPHIKGGRVKLLAVTSGKRSAQAPDVPTVAEVTGIADYAYPGQIGVLAPAGTPPTIIDKLAAEVIKAVRHPDTVKRFTALGIDAVGSTPEEYAANIRSEIEKYARVAKAAGVKIN